MSKLIRKTWPKIRVVTIKDGAFYRVDARRTGTGGRQETFKLLKEAEERASEIAKSFSVNGAEAPSFPAELRGIALTAEKMLKPYGKTLLQAVEFYTAHLDQEKQRKDSALVSLLAEQWIQAKKSGKTKKLRPATLKGIQETVEVLKGQFVGKRVLEVTTAGINKYLDGLKVNLRRKFNVRSRLSQFFNWCINQGHLTVNPCDKIEIHVDSKDDVTIFSPAEALKLMTLCRESAEFKDLILYHAISLFAGLRPSECQLLTWESVHLGEKTIRVLASTSKTKETRNVPIEPNLLTWFKAFSSANLNGFVTPQINLTRRLQALHVAMGYRVGEGNEEADSWPQDVMRHSYGSYWLAKNKQRAVLAEHMGNSLQIIKRHYKRVVSNTACQEYWRITPAYGEGGEINTVISDDIASRKRAERLAAEFAQG